MTVNSKGRHNIYSHLLFTPAVVSPAWLLQWTVSPNSDLASAEKAWRAALPFPEADWLHACPEATPKRLVVHVCADRNIIFKNYCNCYLQSTPIVNKVKVMFYLAITGGRSWSNGTFNVKTWGKHIKVVRNCCLCKLHENITEKPLFYLPPVGNCLGSSPWCQFLSDQKAAGQNAECHTIFRLYTVFILMTGYILNKIWVGGLKNKTWEYWNTKYSFPIT